MKKIFAFLAAAAMMSVMMTGCGNPKESDTTTTIDSSLAQTEENSAPEADINEENSTEEKSPSAEVTDNRTFIITLDAENAPITCENFEKLVSEGFYNGLTFHRVVDNFMAQGGDAVRQALSMTHGGGADHQQGVREGTLAGQVDLGHVDSLVFLKPRLDDGHFFRRRQFRIFLGGRDKVLHVPPIPQSVPEGNTAARPGDGPAHCSGHKKRHCIAICYPCFSSRYLDLGGLLRHP